MDAEGPGNHKPRTCVTRNTFADLGDTRGFRQSGKVGQVYRLELNKDGFYHRVPIANLPEPDWALRLETSMQYMNLEHRPDTHKLIRLINVGKMFVVYKPTGPLELLGYVHFYGFFPKAKGVSLQALTAFQKDMELLGNPPKGSTVYIELVLGAAPSDFVEVLPGLSIKWKDKNLVGFIITKSDRKYEVSCTSSDVTVKDTSKLSLATIHCTSDFMLVRLLFSWLPVSAEYLAFLADDIDRREVILKALEH